MSSNFEALEGDFQATHSIDLREALWGRAWIGVRRLLVLLKRLPEESHTMQILLNRAEIERKKSPQNLLRVLGGVTQYDERPGD